MEPFWASSSPGALPGAMVRTKRWPRLHGIPLLQRVADRLGPQVDALAISGRPRADLADPKHPGPARRAPGLWQRSVPCCGWRTQRGWPLVATVSCDTPFIPGNIVSRLSAALKGHDCAVASRNGVTPPNLRAVGDNGVRRGRSGDSAPEQRSLCRAIARLDAVEVDFSAVEDGPGGDPFFNINSRLDMAAAQAWLSDTQVRMKTQKILGIVGWKNSGKTTLVEALVREMTGRGLRYRPSSMRIMRSISTSPARTAIGTARLERKRSSSPRGKDGR